jgi:trans-aconitate 2-methyltransferase
MMGLIFPSARRKGQAMSWDPTIYLQFAGPRTRPAADLLARVPIPAPARVIDLGCGPGNSTALLAARWPDAVLEGLDSSQSMLDEARASGVPAQWILADLANWAPAAPYDVIYANATFQWLGPPQGLLPRLMDFVAPGGALAFQVPANYPAPSHALMRAVAADPRWASRLKDVRGITHYTAEACFNVLKPLSRDLDIWETSYLHVLEGEDAVYRWVSATGLRPYLDALDGNAREDFIADYKTRLNRAYPRRADGTTLLPFQRLFVVATKG